MGRWRVNAKKEKSNEEKNKIGGKKGTAESDNYRKDGRLASN